MSQRAHILAAVLLLLCLRPATAADPGCPDAELFSGKLITDICWGCLFPIRVAGLSIGGGDRPAAASNQVVCACNDGLGIPHPGLVVSLWEPARIVELTRAPACSPALGGIRLPLGSRRLLVTKLDAARRLGGVLAAADAGLAFCDAGIGPTIGQGLSPLSAGGLARLLLRREEHAMRSGEQRSRPPARPSENGA